MSLVARARALAPQIAACADRTERERELPPDLVAAIARAGLFRMLVPRALGGPEVDLATMIAAIDEVARHDGSTSTSSRMAWAVSGNCSNSPEMPGELFSMVMWGMAARS